MMLIAKDIKKSLGGCLLLCSILLVGCASQKKSAEPDYAYMTLGTLWVQNAGEYKALSYQAYNLAKIRLDYELRKKRRGKRPAVVLDIDETVLDNSPFQARSVLDNTSYPHGWVNWVEEANGEVLPGAREFLDYAVKRGVEVFYITNRKHPRYDATLKNLKAKGLPVKPENLLLRKKERSKKSRREAVLKKHRIVLLIGDNLGDFDEFFESDSTRERNKRVDERRKQFGRKFIVLPNPMYGDWEGAIHGGNMRKAFPVRREERQQALYPARGK